MGTPAEAVPTLRALAAAHEVAAAYTQPDKPRGRGRHVSSSPVKDAALRLGIPVREPRTLRTDEAAAELRADRPDAIVVAAYGKILPPDVLAIPRLGCVNVHFSLLPRWRGAAPVARAIMAGDDITGVVTMLMDEGLDTGPTLLEAEEPIRVDDTTGALGSRLAERGAALIVPTLAGLDRGDVRPRPQPADGVTYADKLTVEEAELDWTRTASELERVVRALDPSPGAFTDIGRRLKVWRADVLPGDGEPGRIAEVTPDGPAIQTSDARLRLLEVQPEGKRRMSGAEFVRGYRPQAGQAAGVG